MLLGCFVSLVSSGQDERLLVSNQARGLQIDAHDAVAAVSFVIDSFTARKWSSPTHIRVYTRCLSPSELIANYADMIP